MEQHLSCCVRAFDDGSVDPDTRFRLSSCGIDRQSVEQAAACLVETVAPGMHHSQLRMRLEPPSGDAAEPDPAGVSLPGTQASDAPGSNWQIRLDGPREVALTFGCPARAAVGRNALAVDWPGCGPDVYEQVLLAFVMPFLGSAVGWMNVDWSDLQSIVGQGRRGRLVATALASQATTADLVAAHQHDLRRAHAASAVTFYSVFMAQRRALREQALAARGASSEFGANAHGATFFVTLRHSDQVRMATLCVF